MQTRFLPLILLPVLVLGIASPGHGQGSASPAPAAAQAASPQATPAGAAPEQATPALAPGQAQQVLDLLRDDKRRAEFTTVLESLAKAAPAAGAATPAPASAPVTPTAPAASAAPAAPAASAAPAAAPSQILPLKPDSLGAQVVDQTATAIASTGSQIATAIHSVNDFPLLWRWITTQAETPDFRARLLNALWRLAVIVGSGLIAELAVTRLLRRMRVVLGQWTPAVADPIDASVPVAESGLAAAEAGDVEQAQNRQLSQAVGTLRRLPYLVGRLLLDLLPIAAFAAAAVLLLGTELGEPAITRLAIQEVINAYVLSRVVLSVTAMLVSPAAPRLRLLHVSDWAAGFLTRWIRRVIAVGVTGYVLAEVGLLFGMYQTAHDALLKLFALVVHGCLIVAVLQSRPHVAAAIRTPFPAQGVWASLRNRLADVWHLIAIFYLVALWLVWAAELRNGYIRLIHFFLVTTAVMVASRLAGVVLLGGLDRLLSFDPALLARHPGLAERAALYRPVLRTAAMAVLAAATVLGLLEAWNLGPVDWLVRNGLGGRVASALTVVVVTVLLAVLVWEGANAAVAQHLARLSAEAHLARAGRLRTLLPMLRTLLLVAILLVVSLVVLSELGVNVAPLLAGAGVIGIAVGFGSQTLVRDLITGLFLLLENTMQVGDIVTLGGLTGTVEALSIRTIRLRAVDGAVHIVPFSAVTTVTNQTRDYGYAVLDISVGLNEEPAHVIEVVRDLAAEMRRDPKWASLVLDELDVMGVEKFIDAAWVLRVRMKTQPASRWSVGRELNRRVKVRFDELAIESPLTSYRVLSAPPAPAPAADPAPAAPAQEAVKEKVA